MMAGFASPEDWSLQAIVRDFTGDCCNSSTAIAADPNSCYGLMDISKDDHDTFFSFPGIFDELQELCKPFYTLSHSSPTQDSSTVGCPITPSNSISVSKESKKEESEEVHHQTHSDQPVTSTAATPYMPKYKRRKNQQKRVVLQVTAEDLSSDKWAWRKYGQKPIKGSPYPRSYYRCSSSKACLARKQVEQSRTDPSIFIITYTAEHNHSQPTRKNALAGTTRHKFSSPKSLTRSSPKAAKKRDSGRCSPSLSAVLSPETPLLAEEDQYAGRIIERINKDENDMQMVNESRNNGIFIPEVMFDDDFFTGLGDWDGFMSGLGDGHFLTEAVSSKYDFCNF